MNLIQTNNHNKIFDDYKKNFFKMVKLGKKSIDNVCEIACETEFENKFSSDYLMLIFLLATRMWLVNLIQGGNYHGNGR